MGSFDRGNRGGGRSFDRPRFGGGNSFGRGGDRGDSRGGDRPLFKTVCSNCGKECEVPFRPTNGKPVYCSDCFEKMGRGRSDSGRQEGGNFRPQGDTQNRAQFEMLATKLDKIIRLLEPKTIEAVMPDLVVEEVKKVKVAKTPKNKKSTSTKKK
ncbi:MAG TPA: CxxC-x17-CxxC domain-containing protein [Patescibacteria group bacterium]|nr:CxxC-x17-CxxC domain-containing protein [Patescibacteria group bacterium]